MRGRAILLLLALRASDRETAARLRAMVAWLILAELMAASGRNERLGFRPRTRVAAGRPQRLLRARGSITGRRPRG